MSERVIVAFILVIGLGIAALLVATMIRAIVMERRSAGISGIWANFGLSMSFLALFLLSWIGQGVAEWGTYVQEVRAHGGTATFGDYIVQFGQSTLENWQSEFLQLFSFVVFSAILIHHGSAESKDGEDRIEQAVTRIEKRLDDAGIGSSASSSPQDLLRGE
jgi:hypothetical protein